MMKISHIHSQNAENIINESFKAQNHYSSVINQIERIPANYESIPFYCYHYHDDAFVLNDTARHTRL